MAVLASAEEAYFCVGADVRDFPPDMWQAVPGLGVELNDQLGVVAKEIDNVSTARNLTLEFKPGKLTISEVAPELAFNIRLIAAQGSRSTGISILGTR